MKKLMIAASVAICAAAGFALESANIVGYAQNKLQLGGTMATPQFINIGSDEGMPITALLPTGDDTYNNIAVQTLDAAGYTVNSYAWTDAGGESWDQIGWVDDENNIVTDLEIAPGQGLWIQGTSDTQYIRFPAPEL